jgi:hypothetical protein
LRQGFRCWLGDLFAADKLCKGWKIRVDDKQLFDTSPEKTVNGHLAVLDANNGTCAGVNNVVFYATTVAKDDNDLVLLLLPYHRLESLDPIADRFHIRLLGEWSECRWVFLGQPRHGEYHKVCLDFKNMEAKLIGVPWRLESVRAVKC